MISDIFSRLEKLKSEHNAVILADSALPQKFKAWVDSHPDHTAITYINCSAGVKAVSDIICTSSAFK